MGWIDKMTLTVLTIFSLIPVFILYRTIYKPEKIRRAIYWLGGPPISFLTWNLVDYVWLLPTRNATSSDSNAGTAVFILGLLVAPVGTIIIGTVGWMLGRYRSKND